MYKMEIDKDKLDRIVSIEKRIHPSWEMFQYVWDRLPEGNILKDHPMVGKYQYFLKSKLGKISLIEIPNQDRKSTRLNSSHGYISYAVFCLKKKKKKKTKNKI